MAYSATTGYLYVMTMHNFGINIIILIILSLVPDPSRRERGQGNREMSIFPVQLTTNRIGNLTRLVRTLLCVMIIRPGGSVGNLETF